MLIVPGGRFTMGRDKGQINERPAHSVDIDAFALDRTEVSALDFAAFLNAMGNEGEKHFTPDGYATVIVVPGDGAGGGARFAARPGYERFPANNVAWNGADSYCRWLGKRLPTEAEWEKAARGTDKRLFPWGRSEPREDLAQFEQTWKEKQFGVLVAVDALPEGASPYGMLNMAGNVLEWVNDWYRQNCLDFCNPEGERNPGLIRQLTGRDAEAAAGIEPAQDPPQKRAAQRSQTPPRNNPTGPEMGSFKVLRGGSWQDRSDGEVTTTRRVWLDPAQRLPYTGFRCATASPRRPASQPVEKP
jgi:formylglycine-generating enzyme required for sulfatase activity